MRLDIRTRVVLLGCVLALVAVYAGSQESPATPPAPSRPAVTISPVTATPAATPVATPAAIPTPALTRTATPPAEATATATSTSNPTAAPVTVTATATAAPPATATPAAATATPPPPATATPSPEPTATTGALPLEALPRIEFVRADGTAVSLPIEVPPRSEYSIGLSGRYELGERGMLFHYEDEGRRSFWMKNTHIDLDIAFIGADFVIREIFGMEAESLEIRRPGSVYRYAVEAPAGWYAANGLQAGDTARFDFDLADYPVE